MRISALEGRRVAIWGYGREGRAALAALRGRLPAQPLTLLCSEEEVAQARTPGDPLLSIETTVDAARLAAFEIVVKSPGISPYAPPAAEAALLGTRFIGGSALWFAERAAPGEHAARTLCVTGTKGKSTTTALIAHLLRAGGHRTALAGNIGLPLLELLDAEAEFWAIELSSYQTRDAQVPEVAVVLNVFPEHLDWHGDEARYVEDKLALLTRARPRTAVIDATDARLAALALPDARVVRFNAADGWHLREHTIHRGDAPVLDARMLPLPGRHNRVNLCAALAAIEALGLDAAALAPHVGDFRPLPHRLQPLGARGGVEYVNDSISTTPHASLAALDCYRGRRVAILVGGYDRGLDWGGFAERIAHDPPVAVVTLGQNGPRIHESLAPHARNARFALLAAQDMDTAVRQAQAALDHRGVVLLSPGAPSFGRYRDYAERGRHFAEVAGFDPAAISAIPGLGIA